MASISKQLSGGAQAPTLKLELTEQKQNAENNTTIIKYVFLIERPSNVSSNTSKKYTLTIGDKTIIGSVILGGNGTLIIDSGTVEIEHNQDGSKTINYRFSIDVELTWSGVYNSTISASSNLKLTDILRITEPSVTSNIMTLGDTITINMNRASATFKHRLKLSLGAHSIVIGENLETSKTWTIPMELANYITNNTESNCILWCYTYQNGVLLGYKGVSLTLKVPTSVIPIITSLDVLESNLNNDLGIFIQHQSKLSVNVKCDGVYNSTIKSISSTVEDVTYKNTSFITNTLKKSGVLRVRTVVKDGRGRTATKYQDINVVEWAEPKINAFSVTRCDETGAETATGEHVKVSYDFSVSPLENKNTKKVVFEYAESNSDVYTEFHEIADTYTSASDFVTQSALFDIDKSYNVRMIVYDHFVVDGMKAYAYVETEQTTFDIHASGQGLALGKAATEPNLLDVNWCAKFRKDVSFCQDTDWVLLELTEDFKPYQDLAENTPKYRIRNKVVEIRGIVSPKTSYASAYNKVPFAKLPSDIIPSDDIYILCPSSNKYTWTFTIEKNGNLSISQHGADSYGTVSTNSRLAFQATYTLD